MRTNHRMRMSVSLMLLIGFITFLTMTVSRFVIGHELVMFWYTNPIASFLFTIGGIGLLFGMFELSRTYNDPTNTSGCLLGLLGTFTAVIWLIWIVIFGPNQLVAGSNYYRYQEISIEQVPLVASPRPASYSEALQNMKEKNPLSHLSPQDMEYVSGEWVASLAPQNIGNQLGVDNGGIIRYKPFTRSVDTDNKEQDQLASATNGIAANNIRFHIWKHDFWGRIEEIVYYRDETNGSWFGVTQFIKRTGFWRVPYVSDIIIIHPGEARQDYLEWLTLAEATEDPRLEGVRLIPEWIETFRINAYGCQAGAVDCLFKRNRLEIAHSEINKENSAPFFMDGIHGGLWVAPLRPYGTESISGVAFSYPDAPYLPVLVWLLGSDTNLTGIDGLANQIKSANVHDANITWQVTSSESKAGETEIVELIPIFVKEDGVTKLYFYGYVSIMPPTETRYYVVIEPYNTTYETYVVWRVNNYRDLERWVQGEASLDDIGLKFIADRFTSNSASQEPTAEAQPSTGKQPEKDITQMSGAELHSLIEELSERILEANRELQQR